MFFKKKQKEVSVIDISDIQLFIETEFNKKFDQKELDSIKTNFNYELSKLNKYVELLNDKEYHTGAIQDRDYFKRVSTKLHNFSKEFIENVVFPTSIFKFTRFNEQLIENIEEFEENISKTFGYLDEIIPKLISRIKSKIEAINELTTKFSRYLEKVNIKLINNINEEIKNYYEVEENIEKLKNEKLKILSELNKVAPMKDKIESRINNIIKNKNLDFLKDLIKEKEDHEEKLINNKSIVFMKLSYLSEMLPDVEFNDMKEEIKKILNKKEDFLEAKNLINIVNDLRNLINENENNENIANNELNNLKVILSTITNLIQEIEKEKEKLNESNKKLNNQVSYLELKEQEDYFQMISKQYFELNSELKRIEDEISDLSIDFAKQKINSELKKFSEDIVVK